MDENPDQKIALEVRPLEWCEAASNMLKSAMVSDPLAGVEALQSIVESGAAALFGVFNGRRFVACYVLKVERKTHGSEGVIVAGAGRLSGVKLLDTMMPHIEGQFIACSSVRVHTARPGMVRKLQQRGYSQREIILSKAVA